MLDTLVRLSSALLLSALVPLAILVSRDKLRQHRRGVLIALEDWMYTNAPKKPLPSFEVARIKYELSPRGGDGRDDPKSAEQATSQGTLLSFALPALIYAGVSGLGFVTALFLAADKAFWATPNFILSGMKTMPDDLSLTSLAAYQWNSGAAITAGFLGAYLFTLHYLVQRVRNYELSPTSFLIASVSILEACFVVGIARHLMFSDTPSVGFTALAFLLGYFPTLGIVWLVEHVKLRNLKRIAPTAYDRRYVMPTDMIDGVDMLTKFRLMEAGVADVQNLATANPVLLYVETPFNLMTILDWISQAQLIVALGPNVAAELRTIGIRTSFDIDPMGRDQATREMVLGKVWPVMMASADQNKATVQQYEVLEFIVTGSVHVRRLRQFWSVMTSLVEPDQLEPEPVTRIEGKSPAFGQTSPKA
jgi:hypothetical protein